MNKTPCTIIIKTHQDLQEFKERWRKLLDDLGELNKSDMDQTYIGEIYGFPGAIAINYPFMCNLPEEVFSFLYDAYGETNIIVCGNI